MLCKVEGIRSPKGLQFITFFQEVSLFEFYQKFLNLIFHQNENNNT